mgnify:CR=1 FL=1
MKLKNVWGMIAAVIVGSSGLVSGTAMAAGNVADGSIVYAASHLPDARYYKYGWEKKDGDWYFNVYRSWAEGWTYINKQWYYFSTSNHKLLTGWQKIGGSWYYLGGNGVMRTGKHKLTWNGKTAWYTFGSNGALK